MGCNLSHCGNGGGFIPWHRDDEHTSGNIHSPKIIVSVSLGIEVAPREQSSRIFLLLQHGDIGYGWACEIGIRSLNSSWSAANKPHVQVDSPTHSKLCEKMLECVVCSHHAHKVCPCRTVVVVEGGETMSWTLLGWTSLTSTLLLFLWGCLLVSRWDWDSKRSPSSSCRLSCTKCVEPGIFVSGL